MIDEEELVFKRKNDSLLNWEMILLLLVALIVTGWVLKTKSYSPLWAIPTVVLILVIPKLYKSSLESISINKKVQRITLVITRWIYIKKEMAFDLEGCKATFQLEVGARGVRREFFRFYYNNKLIIDVYPYSSGWEEGILIKAVETINKLKTTA